MSRELLKRALGYLLYAVVFYLILAYVAGLPMRWSIVLALLFTGIERRLLHFAPKPVQRFSPYYMNVHPNWYEILTDYKIISGKEQWEEIEDTWKHRPRPQPVFIRDGLCFVFVNQSQDFEKTLIFSNDYKLFTSDIDILRDLDGVTIPHQTSHMQEVFGDYQPRFFMKYALGGYDVGIEVESEWWKSMKCTCPQPLEELAKIPLQEFTPYWEPVEYDVNFPARFEKVQQQGREKYGWTRPKLQGNELHPDYFRIDHKYFSVEHSEI
ncbi:MAG: hypothetical protein ACJ72H_03115 [Candidatus Sulfotelmatobacter sp.]